MAKMIPERFPAHLCDEPGFEAERLVYDALTNLSKEWTVLHHVAFLDPQRGGARDREIDFLLMHPQRGLLVLEVKGGAIARDAVKGVWTQTSRGGHRSTMTEPPNKQASGNRYALERLIQREIKRFAKNPPSCGWAVAFPDTSDHGDLSAELPRGRVLYRGDVFDIERAIERTMNTVASGGQVLNTQGVDALVKLLSPSFTLTLALGEALTEVEERIIELTQEQAKILDLLGQQCRAAIHGGAGTGKTVLAREKAMRLARQGEKTLLTCFNIPLAEHLKQSCAGVSNLTVLCIHELMEQHVGAAVIAAQKPRDEDDDATQQWYRSTLPGLYLEALESHSPAFDAVVVDEAQDFHDDWWDALQLSMGDKSTDVLYAFLDPQQGIFRRGEAKFLGCFPTYPLSRNLRNSKPIHDVARRFRRQDDVEAGLDDGMAVGRHVVPEGASLQRELSRVLHRLIREGGLEPERLVVLTLRRLGRVFGDLRDHIGSFPVSLDPQPVPGRVSVSTAHRFKGLERTAVVLVVPDDLRRGFEDSVLYVACSRARAYLEIVGTREALQRFDRKRASGKKRS